MTNNSWTNIFIYGSLKNGCYRSDILNIAIAQGLAEYKYMTQTSKYYDLLDFGSLPGLVYGDSYVGGELYSVSPEVLAVLDSYENHPNIFARKEITLFGYNPEKAEAYYFDLDNDKGLLLNVLQDSSSDRKSFIKNVSKNLKIWVEE